MAVTDQPASPIGSRVLALGVGTQHERAEIDDDPTDWIIGDFYSLMLFHTDFEAVTDNGIELGNAGQVLINSPHSHQWHQGVDGSPYSDDWIHIDGDSVGAFFRDDGIPVNRIFSVSQTDYFTHTIREIEAERTKRLPHWQEIIAGKVMELLLLTQRYHQVAELLAVSPAEHEHYERLRAIRQQLQQDVSAPWTVQEMADIAHLSANRFAVLYKKFFGVPPMDDVIEMRIEEAKWLLRRKRLSVAEVAEMCGFESHNYFSRAFKARTGQTPSAYRR